MKTIKLTPGRLLVMLAVLAACALLAACGSSSSIKKASATLTTAQTGSGSNTSTGSGSTTSTGAGSTSRAALQACLRQHGITIPTGGPPRGGTPPTGAPGAGSGTTGAGSGTPPAGGFTPPAGGFHGGRGRFHGGHFNSSKFRAAFKACGANFPARGRFHAGFNHRTIQNYVTCVRKHGYDLPNPNFSGKGSVFPAGIRTNKKFQTASRACQSLLTPPAGGTSTTPTG